MARASGIAVGLVVAGLLSGCDLDNYPQDLSYGLRTDVIYPDSLIKDLNKNQPKEIDLMLKNGFKLEVEALISKDISYVTEQYVPARLEEGNFLD